MPCLSVRRKINLRLVNTWSTTLLATIFAWLANSALAAEAGDATGIWKSIAGRSHTVHVVQKGETFDATCVYGLPDSTEVRWKFTGRIIEGRMMGKLVHLQAPKDWKLVQLRVAVLSADGNRITGNAIWEDGGEEFEWVRDIPKPTPVEKPIVSDEQRAALEADPKIKSARLAFDNAIKAANEAYSLAQKKAVKQRLDAFKAQLKTLTKAGDFDKAIACKAAVEQLEAENLDPPSSAQKLNTNLRTGDFSGNWQVLDDQDQTAYTIVLEKSGEARKSNLPLVTGKWETFSGGVRVTWSDGWKDSLQPNKQGFEKLGYRPGSDWTDQPSNYHSTKRE